jgi:hypothetical protein
MISYLPISGATLWQRIHEPIESLWQFFETEEGREIGGLAVISFEMFLISLTSKFSKSSSGACLDTCFLHSYLYHSIEHDYNTKQVLG